MEIISPDKAELLVTGFLNRWGKDENSHPVERFMSPYEGSSKIYSQINLVKGKIQYTNPDEVDFNKYRLGNSKRGRKIVYRYEYGISMFLPQIIQPPFLMILDKELETELVFYLSYDGSKNLKKHLMGYQRNHKRNQISNVK